MTFSYITQFGYPFPTLTPSQPHHRISLLFSISPTLILSAWISHCTPFSFLQSSMKASFPLYHGLAFYFLDSVYRHWKTNTSIKIRSLVQVCSVTGCRVLWVMPKSGTGSHIIVSLYVFFLQINLIIKVKNSDFPHPGWHVSWCHCSYLVLATIWLRYHSWSFFVKCRRYSITAGILVLALTSFPSFLQRFLGLGCRNCVILYQLGLCTPPVLLPCILTSYAFP